MEEKVKELAEYLNIEPEEVETLDNSLFSTPEGDFAVYTEEEAHKAVVEDITGLFDDLGLDSFSDNFVDWILANAVDERAVDDFIQEEIDYYGEEDDQDIVDELYNLDSIDEKLDYIRDTFGDKDFSDWIKDKIDIDIVAERAEELDGAGHFLSYYDGEEIELPNYFAYRVN